MLLAPGKEHLTYRKKVKRELIKKFGYKSKNIIIMEQIETVTEIKSLDKKFETIIKKYDPQLIVAFFMSGAFMDAVLFEIGFLCGRYGADNIENRLRFVYDDANTFKNTTKYIGTLLPRVKNSLIDESYRQFKASDVIDRFVGNM
jgi:hypothetical protein